MHRENHMTGLHKRAKPRAKRQGGNVVRHAAIPTRSICDHAA